MFFLSSFLRFAQKSAAVLVVSNHAPPAATAAAVLVLDALVVFMFWAALIVWRLRQNGPTSPSAAFAADEGCWVDTAPAPAVAAWYASGQPATLPRVRRDAAGHMRTGFVSRYFVVFGAFDPHGGVPVGFLCVLCQRGAVGSLIGAGIDDTLQLSLLAAVYVAFGLCKFRQPLLDPGREPLN